MSQTTPVTQSTANDQQKNVPTTASHVATTEVGIPAAACSTQCGCTTERSFTVFESGALKDWIANEVELPGLGKIPGKLFLKDKLGLTACEISINAMSPGGAMPIYHSHKENEEVYVFIHGQGQIQIDGETINVREGTVVRLSPNAERSWRNNSNEMLIYLVMQMREHSLLQWGLGDATVPNKTVTWPSA